MGKILIDTNILIYATLEDDPRFMKSQEILFGSSDPSIERYISVQNLAEMYPNITGPKMSVPDSPVLARRKILSIAHLPVLSVLPLTIEVQLTALELCERYGIVKQSYFDMQLVATMLIYGIPTIVTENLRDFDKIQEITAINPYLS